MNQFMNPYLNQYGMNSYGIAPSVPSQPAQQVVRVNGRNGATQYAMGPNSSAMLLDESGLMVWLCTTDGAGYKTVTAYDITPHQDAPAQDYGSLENRVKKLEDMIHERTADTATVRKKPAGKSDDGAD